MLALAMHGFFFFLIKSLPLELTESDIVAGRERICIFCVFRTSLRILPDMLAALSCWLSVQLSGTHREPPSEVRVDIQNKRCCRTFKTMI